MILFILSTYLYLYTNECDVYFLKEFPTTMARLLLTAECTINGDNVIIGTGRHFDYFFSLRFFTTVTFTYFSVIFVVHFTLSNSSSPLIIVQFPLISVNISICIFNCYACNIPPKYFISFFFS